MLRIQSAFSGADVACIAAEEFRDLVGVDTGTESLHLKAAGSDDSSSICRDMWEKVDFNSSSCCRVRS